MNIDKNRYKKYKMGEIAESISKRIDPAETNADIYVGLEHLDPENIHIREYGKPADVKGVKLEVSKGDIIFGKRRAYQRKAAIAEFDGICSAHAMVLRASPKVMLPELFPFFMHSDIFMNRAIDISEGSLSPTIKWKILKEQEFLLPPLAEQKKLADLLWAGDKVLQRYSELERDLETIKTLEIEKMIWKSDFALKEISESTKSKEFHDGDWIESKDMSHQKEVRLLQLADIGVGQFLDKSDKYISEEKFKELNCYEVIPQDILLARMPDPIARCCIVPDLKQKLITAVDCCVIRIDETAYNKVFMVELINSYQFRAKVLARSSGTTRTRISRKNLEKIKVPLPSKEVQDSIAKKLENLNEILSTLITLKRKSQNLNRSLINKIFR